MIHLTLHPRQAGRTRVELPHGYRVAGVPVWSDAPVAPLEPFCRPAEPAAVVGPGEGAEAASGAEVFHGPAWLAGSRRSVTCRRGPAGYRIEVEGVGRFAVAADGGTARVDRLEPGADAAWLEEAVLGPVLVLALALHGVWSLHASAVMWTRTGRAAAFLGGSGRGKSTLAAALAGAGDGWRLLADDLLPVTLAGDRALAHPRFPQLKLAPERQPGPRAPEALPLAAVYLLAGPPAGGPAEAPRVELVSPREAALGLIRHTVAARLFAPDLLARHLAAAGELAARVPVRTLAYPWTGAPAPGLSELLALDAEAA